MSFFRNTNSNLNEAPGASGAPDVQTKPLALGKNGSTGQIKVDLAYRLGSLTVVAGWSTAGVELGLRAAGRVLQVRRQAVPRPDVATHFNLPSGADLGFVLVAESAGDDAVTLCWREHGQAETVSQPLVLETQPKWRDGMQAPLGSALALLCAAFRPHTDEWKDLVAQLPSSTTPCENARAYLEGASACAQTEEGVAWGWLVHTPGTQVWLEDDAGHTYPFDKAYRRYRQDVADAFGHAFPHAFTETGFVLRLPGLKPGSRLRLKALSEAGVHLLSETSCGTLPADPVAAARLLFGVFCPLSEMHRRVGLVDEPVLAPLIQYRQDMWDELPVHVKRLGAAVERPLVSLIIPLYGRTDFVEHQLIEFAQDAWLRSHAEIIYVVDDPKLVEPFVAQAEALFRLYRLPFTWVWGSVNRGFSGANNLGAEYCTSEHLLFLNSDVFPQRPGWLEAMVEVLKQHPDVGAVGPRLVFGHGAIQHAGIEFVRFEERGVWGNHHPYMGLDPSLDPRKELSHVSAVTGACLMLRRTDFDAVGGWDTGYLVGDYEDSDLCLKLREKGLKIAYLPTVQLTHLERQSFKLLGQDDFRARVAVYNGVRHQTRWGNLIQSATR